MHQDSGESLKLEPGEVGVGVGGGGVVVEVEAGLVVWVLSIRSAFG